MGPILHRALCGLLLAMLGIRAPDFFWFDVRPLAWLARGAGLAAAARATLTARDARSPAALAAVFLGLKARDEARSLPKAMACADARGEPRPCVALVTGANSGIGFATSRTLFEQGYTVVLGCRRGRACRDAAAAIGLLETRGGNVVVPRGGLDLGALPEVRRWVSEYAADDALPPIDVLINNAGLTLEGKQVIPADTFFGAGRGGDGTPGVETGIAVMHIGHHALTRWLIEDRVLDAAQARLVMVSSDAMYFGRFHASLVEAEDGMGDFAGEETIGCRSFAGAVPPFCIPPVLESDGESRNWGSYSRAKLANVLEAKSWFSKTGMHAASVMPGMVYTKMAAKSAPALSGISEQVQDFFMWVLLRSPRASAAVVLRALDDSAGSGRFLNGQGQIMPDSALPPEASDPVVAESLWAVSERMLGKVKYL